MDHFGVDALGSRAFDLDQSKLRAQEVVNQMHGAQTENLYSHANLLGVEARQKEEALRKDQLMSQLVSQAYNVANGADEQPDLAGQFGKLANISMQAGLYKQGEEMAKVGSLLTVRQAREMQAKTSAAVNVLSEQVKQAELIGRFMSDAEVTDQESFDRAGALLSMQLGEKNPLEGMTYTPELVRQLRNGAIQSKDQALLAIREAQKRETAGYRKSRLEQIDTENRIREQRKEVYAAREERLAKAAGTDKGKPVGEPKKADMDAVSAMIQRDFPDLASADNFGTRKEAAYNIASEARRLMQANRALDAATAMGQAYASAVKAGDFQTEDTGLNLSMSPLNRKVTKYSAQGKSAENPATVTPSTKPVVGRFYMNSKGQVAKWTGKGFTPVATGAGGGNTVGLSANNPRVIDNSDDDDEEEE